MRCMVKNMGPFWYCPYLRNEPMTDAQGRKTGGQRSVYGPAVQLKGNISAATGETQVEVFGHLDDYDKVIVLGAADCPINEDSVLFVDKKPEYDPNGDPLFDYTVKRVARSLNSVSYAIRKVEVS